MQHASDDELERYAMQTLPDSESGLGARLETLDPCSTRATIVAGRRAAARPRTRRGERETATHGIRRGSRGGFRLRRAPRGVLQDAAGPLCGDRYRAWI